MPARACVAAVLMMVSLVTGGCGAAKSSGDDRESHLIAASEDGLHLIALDGSGSRPIPGTNGISEPTWSPDGSRVAFSLGGDIYTARADWTDRTLVFKSADSPSWSPDGTRIVVMRDSCEDAADYDACYLALEFDNPVDLYTVGVDGRGVRRLTSNPGYDGDPAWSPDSERIAFAGEGGIELISPDGSDRQLLQTGNFSNPVWSPDGKSIAAEESFNEIVVLDAESGKRNNLTRRQGPDFAPAWSPDGKQIAFLANSACLRTGQCTAHEPWEVWVINVDGTGARRLTKGGFFTPAWGP